jgi:hypothetical protein
MDFVKQAQDALFVGQMMTGTKNAVYLGAVYSGRREYEPFPYEERPLHPMLAIAEGHVGAHYVRIEQGKSYKKETFRCRDASKAYHSPYITYNQIRERVNGAELNTIWRDCETQDQFEALVIAVVTGKTAGMRAEFLRRLARRRGYGSTHANSGRNSQTNREIPLYSRAIIAPVQQLALPAPYNRSGDDTGADTGADTSDDTGDGNGDSFGNSSGNGSGDGPTGSRVIVLPID